MDKAEQKVTLENNQTTSNKSKSR